MQYDSCLLLLMSLSAATFFFKTMREYEIETNRFQLQLFTIKLNQEFDINYEKKIKNNIINTLVNMKLINLICSTDIADIDDTIYARCMPFFFFNLGLMLKVALCLYLKKAY